ncbi:conserved hypothetical protein [Uncinocarpus reesii 1704]|uniref:Polynucleotide 5'-hydroxyl-kinase GRC3 n=1 Tax=Uncinocarpus reesii (strain UAMH 1704) TaxID=336963 RepID=C4JW90_UNCRE|nr:uncharacterized protein UREG_06832 [Uncinocarpus reesii 1704]EEP81967.1 conserved hypothetical protein [Uncinocarpus reesii 1704]
MAVGELKIRNDKTTGLDRQTNYRILIKRRGYESRSLSAIAARKKAHQNAAASAQSSLPETQAIQEAEPPAKRSRPSPADEPVKKTPVQSAIAVVIRNPKKTSQAAPRAGTPVDHQDRSNEEGCQPVVEDNGDITSESDPGDDIEITPKERFENFLLSKGILTKKDILYKTKDSICIRLKEKTTISILGQYDLWVKRGVVSIFGAKVPPSARLYRVYAPSTHSLPVIKAIAGVDGYAEIEIKSCRSGLPRLQRVSDLYRRIWSGKQTLLRKHLATSSEMSFAILHSSSDDPLKRHLRPLHLNKYWSIAIKALSGRGANLRVMTCGPKGSGKSTFNKYLLNHLLSPIPSHGGSSSSNDGVAYLDLDPGQPEFSPPGQVYLAHLQTPVLGPSFSHPALISANEGSIIKSHYIGATSPKDDPDHYILCVMDLLNRYRILLQSYPRCPLIINYSGWIFGQGLEIATWFAKSLDLSDVVYTSIQGPEEVIIPLQAAATEVGVPVTTIPSQPTEYATRSSSQLRSMHMLSYFHRSQRHADIPVWSALPIHYHHSMSVKYAGETQGILGVMVTGFRHDPAHLHDLLDGSIVGIVAVEDPDTLPKPTDTTTLPATNHQERAANHSDPDQDVPMDDANPVASPGDHPFITRAPHTNLPYLFIGNGTCTPLDPASSYSLGLALIRSIDTDSQTIQLTTPIDPRALRRALDLGHRIVLVRGNLDNPNWALSEEYFAARSAQRRQRRLRAALKGDSEGDAEVRARYAEKSRRLAERVRRATKGVPWMGLVRHEGEKGRHGGAGLWKLKKFAQAGGSDGESGHSSS